MELPNIAAYAYQDVHVWSALLTCLRPGRGDCHIMTAPPSRQEGGDFKGGGYFRDANY